jgi:carbon storage regulator
MLVLTRRIGESIILSDDIEIEVLGIDGEQIKLGVKAPKEVSIYRKELYQAIQEENQQALEGLKELSSLTLKVNDEIQQKVKRKDKKD